MIPANDSGYYNSHESERLIYRMLTKEDISLWSTFFIENDSMRFVGSDRFKDLNPMEKATNWIGNQMERYAQDDFGQLAVIEKETGNFIGVAGLIRREIGGKNEFEVTYSLLPSTWGRGYATETALYFKEYAFGNLGLDSVISIIHIENEASEGVANKNGMNKTIQMEFLDMPVHIFRVMK